MISLDERELQVIHDQEFLLTKARASAKIYSLLSNTRTSLKETVLNSNLTDEQRSAFKTDKISKGDNYLGLPYQVLDYPAYFSQKDTFAYRTMFWWGNFFSATLHLDGQFLEHFRERIILHLEQLTKMDVFICVGETPWEYHYGEDNYVPLSQDHMSLIECGTFLKLSKKMELGEWKDLPVFSSTFLEELLKMLPSV